MSPKLSLFTSTQEAPEDCRHVSLTLHRDGILKSSKTAGQRGAYAPCEGHLQGKAIGRAWAEATGSSIFLKLVGNIAGQRLFRLGVGFQWPLQ